MHHDIRRSVRLARLVPVVAGALFFGGCGILCDAEEQLSVTFSTDPTVSIVTATDSMAISMNGSVSNYDGVADFNAIFRAVDDGATLGKAIQITMGGRDPVTDELISLGVVIPTPIRSSSTFQVGGAFAEPFDLPASGEKSHWKLVTTPPNGRALAAFRTGLYTFPPATLTDTYVATEATGTISVTRAGGDGYQIMMDLTFHDSTGKASSVRGRAQIIRSRYTPSCIS